MRRRDFLIGLGAAACPAVARAQKPERLRLIGMLTTSNDPEMKAFEQELEKRGWSEGRNIHIEHRYAPAGTQAETLANCRLLRLFTGRHPGGRTITGN